MSDTVLTSDVFTLVHPLDSAPEPKLFHSGLGRMPMTPKVRAALLTLQLYLGSMLLLVCWRVFTGL